MIPIKTVQKNLDRRLNRLNSEHSSVITVQEKDYFINQAIEIWQENVTALAETNSRIREDLRTLLCSDIELENAKVEDKKCNLQYDVYKYPEDFYRRLRVYGIACSKDCPDEERFIKINIIQRDDLNKIQEDCMWNASFEWGETFAVESKDGIEVYHQDKMEFKCVAIDYFVEIPKVCFATGVIPLGCYEDPYTCEIVTEDKHLELCNNYQMRKILDIAALLIRVSRGDGSEYQLELSKIINVEKLYLN